MTTIDEHFPERLIDKRELKLLVGFSHQHILRLEKAGKFPRRIQISENSVRWRLGDIQDWIEQRKLIVPLAHRDDPTQQQLPFDQMRPPL